MSDTDILVTGEHPQQKTLEQTDELALFTEQESEFIENLNVDAEQKHIPKPIMSEEPTKQIDVDETKIYVMKCMARQDLVSSLASIEKDFFDKVAIVVDEMTEASFFRLETFVNTRLERIVMYSKNFSENVCLKLTSEEQELYTDLCDTVLKYRKKLDEKIKLNK